RPVWRVDIADHPADPVLRVSPRKDLECREIWREQHVRLLDPDESLDRGAVEHDVAGERLLELRRRDLDILVDPKDVGELEPHETDVEVASELEDFLLTRAGRVRNERPPGSGAGILA